MVLSPWFATLTSDLGFFGLSRRPSSSRRWRRHVGSDALEEDLWQLLLLGILRESGETNFAFVSRPMEHGGSDYHFKPAERSLKTASIVSGTGTGTGTCRSFLPGYTLRNKSHPTSAESGKKYLLMRAVHRASIRGVSEESAEAGKAHEYESSFESAPIKTVWRPIHTTPWPAGTVQTALIESPSGEEISIDHSGHIKVRSHGIGTAGRTSRVSAGFASRNRSPIRSSARMSCPVSAWKLSRLTPTTIRTVRS